MLRIHESTTDDFQRDVDRFFASLSWVYLRSRYDETSQGRLLRVFTLSGLEPSWWAPCATQLVARPDSLLAQTLAPTERGIAAEQLMKIVSDIHEYAMQLGASIGEPPRFPLYLVGYGYTQQEYLTDIHHLYGPIVAQAYRTPWPLAAKAPLQISAEQPTPFQRSVAIMGATAGAIERILALGGEHDPKQ